MAGNGAYVNMYQPHIYGAHFNTLSTSPAVFLPPVKEKQNKVFCFTRFFFCVFYTRWPVLVSLTLKCPYMASVKLECGRDEMKQADKAWFNDYSFFFSRWKLFSSAVDDQVAHAVPFGDWTACTPEKRRVSCNRRLRRPRQSLRTQKISVSFRSFWLSLVSDSLHLDTVWCRTRTWTASCRSVLQRKRGSQCIWPTRLIRFHFGRQNPSKCRKVFCT